MVEIISVVMDKKLFYKGKACQHTSCNRKKSNMWSADIFMFDIMYS